MEQNLLTVHAVSKYVNMSYKQNFIRGLWMPYIVYFAEEAACGMKE
jgi:hypothetical protein